MTKAARTAVQTVALRADSKAEKLVANWVVPTVVCSAAYWAVRMAESSVAPRAASTVELKVDSKVDWRAGPMAVMTVEPLALC